MSLWPIISIQCYECHTSTSVFDYGLDADDDQQEFFDALIRDGWDVPGRGKAGDVEADDDGAVLGYCPKCKGQRS